MLIRSPAHKSCGASDRFLAPHAVPVHVAFQFISHPNCILASSTATLCSRPAMGCIIMWQAESADLN